MLTITGLVSYKTLTPTTRTKPPRDGRTSFSYKPSRPGMSAKERLNERRAQARDQGWCGVCTYRRPRQGFKLCEHCK